MVFDRRKIGTERTEINVFGAQNNVYMSDLIINNVGSIIDVKVEKLSAIETNGNRYGFTKVN